MDRTLDNIRAGRPPFQDVLDPGTVAGDALVGGVTGGLVFGALRGVGRAVGGDVLDDAVRQGDGVVDDAARGADDLVPCASFAASTPVLMADGSSKAIAEVEVGDEVLATDPETGESGPREVTATFPHVDVLVALDTSAGAVMATEDHRCWNVTDRAWQESQDLDPGDLLLAADGTRVSVEALDWTTRHTAAAYDLTIADRHTYYVAAGTSAILVHNCSPGDSPVWQGLQSWRGKTKTNGLSGRSRRYFEWNFTHSDIEVYDRVGRHLGSMDPSSGEMVKPPVAGRRISVT